MRQTAAKEVAFFTVSEVREAYEAGGRKNEILMGILSRGWCEDHIQKDILGLHEVRVIEESIAAAKRK